MSLCASVCMCFVVTCWERADLLALVCGVYCEFVNFPLVSLVRCGTWLYRFLIFAPLLTSRCHVTVSVKRLFLTVPWVGLQCVVAFPGHTHLLVKAIYQTLLRIFYSHVYHLDHQYKVIPFENFTLLSCHFTVLYLKDIPVVSLRL